MLGSPPGATYPDLRGKPVLVTGGGSGIGAAVVAAFAQQGAKTSFLDLNPATAQQTSKSLADAGYDVSFEVVDLKDIGQMRDAIGRIEARDGPIRVLVNNAGDDTRHDAQTLEPEHWDDRFAVNARHQFFAAQTVAPAMARAGGGAIINLGSTAWMFGAAGMIAYAAAKASIQGLTKSLARELGGAGIRVNCIAPGWVLTEKQIARTDATAPDKYASFLDRQCIKEHLQPSDIAALALWLGSDEARRCTGQTFIIDAGVV